MWTLSGPPSGPPLPDATEHHFYLRAGGRVLVATVADQAGRLRPEFEAVRGLLAELVVVAQEAFEGQEASADRAAMPDANSLYFPTREGAKRVYAVTARKTTTEFAETVAKVEESGEGLRVTTEREAVGGNVRTVIEVSAKGVYQAEFAGTVYRDAIPLLKLPAKAGDSWTADLNVPAAGKVRFTYTVRGEEEVQVPAGTFKALQVEWQADENALALTATRWYAPGVGLVKEVTSSGGAQQTQVLKSFRAAK